MLLNDSRQPKGIGIIIGQHFNYVSDGWTLDQRMGLLLARVLGRQEQTTSKYKTGTSKDPMGHIIYDKDSVGDLLLSNLWIQYKATDPPDIDLFAVRPIPAWAYAWGTKVVRPNGYAPTPGPSCVVPTGPDMYCLPLSKRNDVSGLYITDAAFRKVKFDVNDEWQHFPIGYCGIKISGTLTETEGKQRELFMPTDPRLISCPDDDPKFNTRVHDVNYKAEIDPDRWAQLNTMMRVIKIPDIGTLANPNKNVINSKNSLGWVIGRSGYENLVGGLVIDYHQCNTFPARKSPVKQSSTMILPAPTILMPRVVNKTKTVTGTQTTMVQQSTPNKVDLTQQPNPLNYLAMLSLLNMPLYTVAPTWAGGVQPNYKALIMLALLVALSKKGAKIPETRAADTVAEIKQERKTEPETITKQDIIYEQIVLRPPSDTSAEIPPVARNQAKLALIGVNDGGFLEIGDIGDKHEAGQDADTPSNKINGAHISYMANFFMDRTKDAPLDFDIGIYDVSKISKFENLTNVYLRYDPTAKHYTAKGVEKEGLFRWVAETPYSAYQLLSKQIADKINIATGIMGNMAMGGWTIGMPQNGQVPGKLDKGMNQAQQKQWEFQYGKMTTENQPGNTARVIIQGLPTCSPQMHGVALMSESQSLSILTKNINLKKLIKTNREYLETYYFAVNDVFFGVGNTDENDAISMEYSWGLVNKALQFRRHYGEKKSKLIDIDSNSIRLYLGKDTAAELVHNNTKDRTYLFPDKDGTIVLLSDIKNLQNDTQAQIEALRDVMIEEIENIPQPVIPEPDIDFTLAVTMAVAMG